MNGKVTALELKKGFQGFLIDGDIVIPKIEIHYQDEAWLVITKVDYKGKQWMTTHEDWTLHLDAAYFQVMAESIENGINEG